MRLLRVVRQRVRALDVRAFPRWGFGAFARARYLRRPRGFGLRLAKLVQVRRVFREDRP